MLDGQYDGMAPNAKLAFNDYSSGGEGLCIPPSPERLYGNGYNAGARIHSNSWGSFFSGTQYYTGADADAYLMKNPVSLNHIHCKFYT
jgi:serine protease AprX